MLQILDGHSEEAKRAAASFQDPDVYYRPEYLALSELAGEGRGRVAFYTGAKGKVLYPFMLREVPSSLGEKSYFDIASPYGYGGPLYEPKDSTLAQEFAEVFHAYCLKNGIVAEFIRFFHPVFANHEVFEPSEALVPRGQVAVWELDRPEGTLYAEVSLKVKRNFKTAERAGVEVVFDEDMEQLEDFIFLYETTMERRRAEGRYVFGREYFEFIKGELKNFAFLTTARLQGKTIASALFFASGPYIAYHLAGSDSAFRASCANELLLFRTALWCKERGFRFLNLGGGVGGKEDSLFQFKASFTPLRRPSFLAKVIHDKKTYEELVETSGKSDTEFFPAYRG